MLLIQPAELLLLFATLLSVTTSSPVDGGGHKNSLLETSEKFNENIFRRFFAMAFQGPNHCPAQFRGKVQWIKGVRYAL